MISGRKRGHLVMFKDGHWRYEDGVLASQEERPCVKCGLTAALDGPDPCLGFLPGVASACCGHGVESAYVITRDLPGVPGGGEGVSRADR